MLKFKAFAGITAGLVALFTATATASGATQGNPLPADCKRVAVADQTLCHKVYLQHPFGAAYGSGDNISGWSNPSGKVIVKEVTHDGLTKREIHDGLVANADEYRLWVTGVPVNMDSIVRKCGNTDGQWVIRFHDEDGKPGGRKLTYKYIDCA